MDFIQSVAAQRRLHELVPGGSHTYARGSDQYPVGLAPVIARGHGARVVDLDGNEFVEYGMGLRAVTLGHGHPPVVEAVTRAAGDGVSFTRPSVAPSICERSLSSTRRIDVITSSRWSRACASVSPTLATSGSQNVTRGTTR